ncbi:hypothetical protein [Nesterenkonia populi]|uniref:hypothetical protein n=1 Tax=Nesterenkonia populi TaxID=1591087 RepID=UPI0011BDFCEA|nr:hypothetical protein [Nesterenkonia populi]
MLAATACALAIVAALLGLPRPPGALPRRRGREPVRERLLRLRPVAERPAGQEEAAQLLRQLAALLASGRGEAQAWADLRDHWARTRSDHPFVPIAGQIAASEISGAGTAEGIRRSLSTLEEKSQDAAQKQTRRVLTRLLAVTRLSEQTGAPLSQLIERLAASLDDAAQLRAAVRTAAAGPRLTQLILTLLPLGGVLLGQLMGADPVSALLGSAAGLGCLGLGLLFLLAGRLWSRHMIRSVEARI